MPTAIVRGVPGEDETNLPRRIGASLGRSAGGRRRASAMPMRLVPLAVVALAAFPLAGSPAAAGRVPGCTGSCFAAPAGSGPLFVVSGHGWGHGVGMSQYGAYGYAQH